VAHFQIPVRNRIFFFYVAVVRFHPGHQVEGTGKKIVPELLLAEKLLRLVVEQAAVVAIIPYSGSPSLTAPMSPFRCFQMS